VRRRIHCYLPVLRVFEFVNVQRWWTVRLLKPFKGFQGSAAIEFRRISSIPEDMAVCGRQRPIDKEIRQRKSTNRCHRDHHCQNKFPFGIAESSASSGICACASATCFLVKLFFMRPSRFIFYLWSLLHFTWVLTSHHKTQILPISQSGKIRNRTELMLIAFFYSQS